MRIVRLSELSEVALMQFAKKYKGYDVENTNLSHGKPRLLKWPIDRTEIEAWGKNH